MRLAEPQTLAYLKALKDFKGFSGPGHPFCHLLLLGIFFNTQDKKGTIGTLISHCQFSIFNSKTDAPPFGHPPARRGHRAQFRPPLPSSPFVGEEYSREEWLDGTGNKIVTRNTLRQRRCLPSALRGLNALKGFKDLSDLSGPSRLGFWILSKYHYICRLKRPQGRGQNAQ